jgi:hypothetical protein
MKTVIIKYKSKIKQLVTPDQKTPLKESRGLKIKFILHFTPRAMVLIHRSQILQYLLFDFQE